MVRAKRRAATASVAAKARVDGRRAVVSYSAQSSGRHDTVFASLVQDRVRTSVPRGENAGKALEHVNVVRALSRGPVGERSLKLPLPQGVAPKKLFAVLWVQRDANYEILAATRAPIV